MPTEMELTLEQTQQGVSHEVSNLLKSPSHNPCDFCQPEHQSEFILNEDEILLESTSTVMVDHHGLKAYENVGPEGAVHKYGQNFIRWRRDCAWLMISRGLKIICHIQVKDKLIRSQ
ncbi:hypothetical protein Tco_0059259 [Tanacetum coccineum]